MVNFLKIKKDNFPFFSAVSMGRIPGVQHMFKFGTNETVNNSTFEDIWSAGGIEVLLSTAETIDVVSNDADDTLGGTGLQTMRIKGFDASYNPVQEDITLNGLTPVTTACQYLRMYRSFGLVAGSSGSNEGTISFASSDTSTVMGQIPPEENQTQKTQFTIPAAYYGLVLSISQSGSQASDWVQRLRVKEDGLAERTLDFINTFRNLSTTTFTIPLIIPPKADIKLQAKSTDSGTVAVTASYELMLVKEDLVNASYLTV
jgi:hypothetical protein